MYIDRGIADVCAPSCAERVCVLRVCIDVCTDQTMTVTTCTFAHSFTASAERPIDVSAARCTRTMQKQQMRAQGPHSNSQTMSLRELKRIECEFVSLCMSLLPNGDIFV